MLDEILSKRILAGEHVSLFAEYAEHDTKSDNDANRVYAALCTLSQRVTCTCRTHGLRYSLMHMRNSKYRLVIHVGNVPETFLSNIVSILTMPSLEFICQKPL